MSHPTIGDYKDGGPAFVKWRDAVKAVGGTPTAWPFRAGTYATYAGRPAAKYPARLYGQLANARQLPDAGAPVQATLPGREQYVYVLATTDVAQDAPQDQLTAWQRAENAAFTAGDRAAGAIGLPSLAGFEKTLILILALVGAGLFLLARGRRSTRSED